MKFRYRFPSYKREAAAFNAAASIYYGLGKLIPREKF